MLRSKQQPSLMLFTTLVFALIAVAALVVGVVLLANIAGGMAQLLVLTFPLALLSQAII
ncbi:MAG: hypothetical protein HY862_10740 [Chloroflexi bacterium]|nr:hypothetical protein [Chloroflexota bacterium]